VAVADNERLVLAYPGLASRIESLYDDLNGDEAFRAQFVANPAGIASERILGRPAPQSDVDVAKANRVLFSVLSNRDFMRWAEGFERRHADAVQRASDDRLEIRIDREEMLRELAEAIWEHGDRELLASMTSTDLDATAEDHRPIADLPEDVRPESLIADESTMRFRSPMFVTSLVQIHHTHTVDVVVLILAIVVIPVPGAVRPQGVLGRDDLQRASSMLVDALTKRASELRESGGLRPGGGAS
jgi:hypothetical protein